eukprot:NODE_136_length_1235_cov_2.335432_g133_i0.p1 GENE.NODE_136_length_1235_cov_2.335432_g133_i0~~NODE_136_length_1235_cov_2.335432_g133_i0.p1  ORF type:complete len:168 (-),score=17.32 NODE_136_length_1235_cov_2.335432_g133_i0:270-773(-)
MKPFIIAAIASFLAACSLQPTNTLSVISSAADLSYHYESGEAVGFIDNAELTDLEVTVVLEALDQIDRSKARLKAFTDEPERFVTDITLVSFEYAKIRSSYLGIRQVVLDNRDEYSPEEWRVFEEFDAAAGHLDKEFAGLVASLEANTALQTAFRLADTAVKIAALL